MKNIRHELFIKAPVEKVYEAITTREGLAAWWTPEATAEAVVDSIARFPFGPAYFKEMKIVALTPHKLVRWLCIKGADEWVGTTLSFELLPYNKEPPEQAHPEIAGQVEQQQDIDQATILVFQHDGWKEYTPMFAECNYTWGQFLRSLKLYCQTGKGLPWPEQHR